MGTNNKPKPDIQPKPSDDACYVFQQGDFRQNDASQGNQVFSQMNECIPEALKDMRAAIKETGNGSLLSGNIATEDFPRLRPFGEASYELGQDGAFVGSDEGHQVFCLMNEG